MIVALGLRGCSSACCVIHHSRLLCNNRCWIRSYIGIGSASGSYWCFRWRGRRDLGAHLYEWENPTRREWLIQISLLSWHSNASLFREQLRDSSVLGNEKTLALKDPLSKKCPKNIWSWARPCKYWMKSVNIWSYISSFSERGFWAWVWFVPTPAHHWSQQHQFSVGSVYFRKALTDLWKGRRWSQTGFQYLYYWRKGSLSVVLSKNGGRQILDIYIPVWLLKNIRATWLLHNCN